MNYILCMDSLHLKRLFIPRANDFLYDWIPVRLSPRTNDSTLRIYLRSSSVNKLMTWSRTYFIYSVRTDDLFPDRISILRTNRWPPFRTDDLFPNIISFLRTNCLLRTNSLHLNWLFIPCTIDSPYEGPIPVPPEQWGTGLSDEERVNFVRPKRNRY